LQLFGALLLLCRANQANPALDSPARRQHLVVDVRCSMVSEIAE
jgi:hypothetical protein